MQTYGLILAGGLSSRMGQNKADLTLGEQSLLARNQQILSNAGISKVVTSGNGPDQLPDLHLNIGPLAGIYAFCQAYPDAEDVLVLAVDMPALDEQALIELLNYGQHYQVSCCFDTTWLPAYFADLTQLKSALNDLINHPNPKARSIHALFKQMQGQTLPVTNRAEQLINVNTPEQWQVFLTHFMNQSQEK